MTKPLPIIALALTLSLSSLTGCEKKAPAAAKATLTKALDALKAKKRSAFLEQVLPEQRDSFTLNKPLSIDGRSLKRIPTEALLSTKLFATITGYHVTKSTKEGDDRASFLLSFKLADGSSSTFYFWLKKQSGSWKIDLKKTVDWEIKLNGSRAFTGFKLKK